MQKIIKSSIALLFIFIIGVFFVSLNKNPNYDTKNLTGKEIINIKLESFENNKIFTNEDFANNKFTLINFWASWCAPCRIEHPNLMELSKEQNIKILGINFKDRKANALKFLEDLGNPYDYLVKDVNGKQSVNFGIYGIPESILLNNKFVVIKKFIGPLNMDDLEDIKRIISVL